MVYLSFHTHLTAPLLVPSTDELTVEGSLIAVKLTASVTADDGAVVDIVSTVTLAAMELGAVFLPRQGITGTAILLKAVGTLTLIGDEHIVVAAGADDDAVVGTQDAALLVLTIGGERNILNGTIVVAGALDMTDALVQAGLNVTEMARIADDACQLTRHRMELRIKKEIATVLAIDGVFDVAGSK